MIIDGDKFLGDKEPQVLHLHKLELEQLAIS